LGFATRELPLSPRAFATGLTIFMAAPTTLGVGQALVQASGGNAALALLLLVETNMLSIVTMPLWLHALLGTMPGRHPVTVNRLYCEVAGCVLRVCLDLTSHDGIPDRNRG
jgi:predicted Na+-dependent transporter